MMSPLTCGDRRGRARMTAGFTTTCAYHHWCCEFESRSGRGVQHYVIKFVDDLPQVGGFLRVLQLPPPIKTDHHDIAEILVKVALSATKQTSKHMCMCMLIYHSQWHHYRYIIYPLYISSPMLFIYFFFLYFSKYVIWLNDNNLIR